MGLRPKCNVLRIPVKFRYFFRQRIHVFYICCDLPPVGLYLKTVQLGDQQSFGYSCNCKLIIFRMLSSFQIFPAYFRLGLGIEILSFDYIENFIRNKCTVVLCEKRTVFCEITNFNEMAALRANKVVLQCHNNFYRKKSQFCLLFPKFVSQCFFFSKLLELFEICLLIDFIAHN